MKFEWGSEQTKLNQRCVVEKVKAEMRGGGNKLEAQTRHCKGRLNGNRATPVKETVVGRRWEGGGINRGTGNWGSSKRGKVAGKGRERAKGATEWNP